VSDIDASWAAMPPEAQAEYTLIFGTEDEQYERFLARGAEPFGLHIYSPEQWRRRRGLDVIRIVDAHGRVSTVISRRVASQR
jgi:hypothetical protein